MSVRRLAKDQPAHFEFTPENLAWAKELIAKYPEGKERSAVIPLLWRAQEQNDGWTSEPAMRVVADMLGIAYIRVYEVATFYTMFQLSPVGKKAHVQVCGTTPCMLRGAKDLIEVCKRRIAKTPHTLSEDGDFSWEEVECLGACVNAPMIQIFKDTYEDLDEASLEELLNTFAKGEQPKPGPQINRDLSCPEGGLTSLIDVPPYVPLNKEASASSTLAAAPVKETTPAPEAVSPAAEPKSNETTVDEPKSEENTVDALQETRDEPVTTASERAEETDGKPARPEGLKGLGAIAAAALAKKAGFMANSANETNNEGVKPEALESPNGGQADDLKLIKGVGPKLEQTLNELGIYHYEQIANWSRDNIDWVDNFLSFKGRIDREEWLPQAKVLASGGETEFSKRAAYEDTPGGEG